MKYLIVQLDDLSPSFCHYSNKNTERKLIALETLKAGIIWAMKENLMVQFVYPNYELPKEYLELIDTVDHIDIERDNSDADVSVFDGSESLSTLKTKEFPHVVLRLSKCELFDSVDAIRDAMKFQSSLNIVITDIETFRKIDFEKYKIVLEELSETIIDKMKSNEPVKMNLLTDRLLLTTMNNCNAGDESITFAPDGKFYICPAFYFDKGDNIGNPITGLSIPNSQLYKLEKAPMCRNCDAFQCKRCVWLNQKTTLEVNTPSREQCVISHLERNASRQVLEKAKELGLLHTNMSISMIDYLDPFDKVKR